MIGRQIGNGPYLERCAVSWPDREAGGARAASCEADTWLERLLGTDHIPLTGRYRIALPEALRDRGAYRELNTTPAVAA